MKNISYRILLGLMIITNPIHLNAYSLLFVNETNIPVSIRLEASFMPKNSADVNTVKMHHVIEPRKKQKFNYVKTKDCQRIQSLSFEFNYSSDPLAIPCYKCDAHHDQQLNKKLLLGKQGHLIENFSGQENETIYIKQILSASLVGAKD